ncbi:hypothetical protein HCR_17250 [Hydrogenimonas cancrithermarum]|uniref:Uncharacterized protein n=1 Tax=Hydrogenimonas cancrithermarum TaxID=2993563 RepID=A0ABM8FNQ3_9BACT|nr:hypothetical protein HCR_17250 [Hydrogenimonas cancrithermarum]
MYGFIALGSSIIIVFTFFKFESTPVKNIIYSNLFIVNVSILFISTLLLFFAPAASSRYMHFFFIFFPFLLAELYAIGSKKIKFFIIGFSMINSMISLYGLEKSTTWANIITN